MSDYGLLTVGEGILNMHRLVQAVARERMGAERAEKWVQVALNLLYEAYNFDPHDMDTWAQCGQLLPHVTTAVNLAAEWEVSSKQMACLNNEVGVYLQQYGDYEAARPFYEQALVIRQKVLGDDHPDTAQSLNNMGGLLQVMETPSEARLFYEQALAIRQKILGDDHPDTASSLNNMGAMLLGMGALDEARPFYEQALVIRQKILGDDHPDTATSLNNMGYLLQEMGQLAEARPFYEQALAIRQKVLGDDHPHTATILAAS